jgi:hypothetical protein
LKQQKQSSGSSRRKSPKKKDDTNRVAKLPGESNPDFEKRKAQLQKQRFRKAAAKAEECKKRKREDEGASACTEGTKLNKVHAKAAGSSNKADAKTRNKELLANETPAGRVLRLGNHLQTTSADGAGFDLKKSVKLIKKLGKAPVTLVVLQSLGVWKIVESMTVHANIELREAAKVTQSTVLSKRTLSSWNAAQGGKSGGN